jgi:hypothetical protein
MMLALTCMALNRFDAVWRKTARASANGGKSHLGYLG